MKSQNVEMGYRIYNLRVVRGYSRERLSGLADISVKFLYEIETGKKSFSVNTLIKLSGALDISSDYILTGSDDYIDEDILKRIKQLQSCLNK